MTEQDSTYHLNGTVQFDGAYFGGVRAGGKPGRGAKNKVPFVAAFSFNEAGHPMYLRLHLFSGFTSTVIGNWAQVSLERGTLLVIDGLICLGAITESGCIHWPLVDNDLKPCGLPQFK